MTDDVVCEGEIQLSKGCAFTVEFQPTPSRIDQDLNLANCFRFRRYLPSVVTAVQSVLRNAAQGVIYVDGRMTNPRPLQPVTASVWQIPFVSCGYLLPIVTNAH